MILGVSGHRPHRLGGYNIPNPIYDIVWETADRCLMQLQPERVITGMALGFDQWIAEICYLNDIPYTAAIPFPGSDSKWPPRARHHFELLLSRAAAVVTVSQQTTYHPSLLRRRNEWVVNHSEKLLVCWNGLASSGTGETVQFAHNVGREVLQMQFPETLWSDAAAVESGFTAARESRHRAVEDIERARQATRARVEIIAQETRERTVAEARARIEAEEQEAAELRRQLERSVEEMRVQEMETRQAEELLIAERRLREEQQDKEAQDRLEFVRVIEIGGK